MEEDYAKIVMQCLLEPSALSPEKILRREHLIASSMYRDAVTALIDRDVQLAKNVVARDNEVDRLYFLLVRILRTVVQNPSLTEKLKIYPIDCLDYRLTASLIESVADQSTQIAEDAVRFEDSKLSVESSNALSEIHKVVYDSYDDAVTAFFSRNISIADSVREKRATVEELYHNVESVASTLPVGSAQNLISVVSLINRIYDHSVDISDLTTPRTS
jgi:phosphate uptake regulator